MQEIQSFNDFMSLQTNIFRTVFKDVDVLSENLNNNEIITLTATPTTIKTTNLTQQKEEKLKVMTENSIKEVKMGNNFETSKPYSMKKDVKRLDNAKFKPGIEKDKNNTGSSSQSTKKKAIRNKLLSNLVVLEPQFELID